MLDLLPLLLKIVFIIFATGTAIQLFYYLFFYLAVHTRGATGNNHDKPPVSVIICARNEGSNLAQFLPSVLTQDYPDYEVVVVNDCSEDDSFNVLGNLLKQYPHLKISNINKDPKFTHNKKFAQFIGIKAAKNEILIFTDADCKPESSGWIEAMVANYDQKVTFVLGYGGYLKTKGLLNKYIRYDCLFIGMQYLGMALRGLPYMGVGRNLSYRRSVFFANKGYGQYSHIISGDDDLFVNGIATRTNTRVEYSQIAHTRSVPYKTFREWILQKKRHFTTAPYYKFRDKVLLTLEPLSRILFYISFIYLLTTGFLLPEVLGLFGLRLIIQFTVLTLASKRLNEPGLMPFLLFFDIFSPVLNGVIYVTNLRNTADKNKWR